MIWVIIYIVIAVVSGYYLIKKIKEDRRKTLEMEQTSLKIWELDGVSKTVDIDSSAKELQEILSCPTCAFFVGGEQLWCSSPENPDVQGKYCNTFRVKKSGESGK